MLVQAAHVHPSDAHALHQQAEAAMDGQLQWGLPFFGAETDNKYSIQLYGLFEGFKVYARIEKAQIGIKRNVLYVAWLFLAYFGMHHNPWSLLATSRKQQICILNIVAITFS